MLSAEEQEALQETKKWIERPPGLIGKAMSFMGKPIDYAYSKVPDNIKEGISNSLFQVLTSVRDHSRSTVRHQELYDQLSQEACQDVRLPHQVLRLPLRVVDKVARRIVTAHRQLAVLQGGATGLAGLPGLIADVPSLYFLVFRCVEEVAMCYGFPANSEAELDHVLKVVDVGHYLENDTKRKAMIELETLQDMMRQGVPMKDLERTVIAKGLQAFARQLATAITRRKLAQTVAIVGAAVGASVNSALVGDVGDAAYYAYRRRFLMEQAVRRAAQYKPEQPQAQEPADPAPEPPAPEPQAEVAEVHDEVPIQATPIQATVAEEPATEAAEEAVEVAQGETPVEPAASPHPEEASRSAKDSPESEDE